ncbi:AraC family transcriptional regulator [Bacillus sp. mrc49]|nr:AraC family transcriptional regulator [Bacillus sp. mrc49]
MIVLSFVKTINKDEEWGGMAISRKIEVEQLKHAKSELFNKDVLHILNGQAMYEDFKENHLMGNSDYVPFNEAMCVNATTPQVFDQSFIKTRAAGHHESVKNYMGKVIEPLNGLFHKEYTFIVLWFGEDMFCQMNLLTLLSYLEQSRYAGKVFLNSFKEDEWKVSQTELTLGTYQSVYQEVLVNHAKPAKKLTPIMDQAIDLYLDMLKANNAVVTYISKNKHLPTSELVNRLFDRFPSIGYGDSQYIELINEVRS